MEIPKFVPNPNGLGLEGNRPLWQPGQSGNPKGGFREKPFRDALRFELDRGGDNDKSLREIAVKLIELAKGGEAWAIQMVCERLDGKAPQEIKVTRSARDMSLDEILSELAQSRAAPGVAVEETGTGESAGVH